MWFYGPETVCVTLCESFKLMSALSNSLNLTVLLCCGQKQRKMRCSSFKWLCPSLMPQCFYDSGPRRMILNYPFMTSSTSVTKIKKCGPGGSKSKTIIAYQTIKKKRLRISLSPANAQLNSEASWFTAEGRL